MNEIIQASIMLVSIIGMGLTIFYILPMISKKEDSKK